MLNLALSSFLLCAGCALLGAHGILPLNFSRSLPLGAPMCLRLVCAHGILPLNFSRPLLLGAPLRFNGRLSLLLLKLARPLLFGLTSGIALRLQPLLVDL